MSKHILIGIIIALLSSTSAAACSCMCNFEQSVSEYLGSHKAFWGTPKQSLLTSDYLVRSKVEVLEGYGRIVSGTIIEIDSQPDDGASCGTQLFTGVPQFIVTKTIGDKNIASTCNCTPPTVYLLEYLIAEKDTYLPSLNKCWGSDDEIKNTKTCEVWGEAPDDGLAEHSELMRMHKLQRGKQTVKSK